LLLRILLDQLEKYIESDSNETSSSFSDDDFSISDMDSSSGSESGDNIYQLEAAVLKRQAALKGSQSEGQKDREREKEKEKDSSREKEKEKEKDPHKEKEKEKEREIENDKVKDKDKDKDNKDKEKDKEEKKSEKSEKSSTPKESKRGSNNNVNKPPKKIPPIPRDLEGKPILPMRLGILTLVSLGEILWDNPNFHNARYIWPVGFESVRSYASMKYNDKMANYTCRIKNQDGASRFEIIPDDDPENVVSAPTATGAWTTVLKEANRIRNKESTNSASGPDYFGFSHPVVIKLIQDLPNAKKCSKYVWQTFVEADTPNATKKKKEPIEEATEGNADDFIDELTVDD